jgi:hypothetical protein
LANKKTARSGKDSKSEILRTLILGGNNLDILDWEKLSERIAQSPPTLEEPEYCERVLQVANGASLSVLQWNQLVGLSIVIDRADSGSRPLTIPAPSDRIAWLRENLTRFVQGSKSTKKAMHVSAASDLSNKRVLIVPSYAAGRRLDRVINTGVNSALVYGLWLLFDASRGYAEKLLYCRYDGCGDFFLKRTDTGGAPARLYCAKHRRIDAGEAAKLRMRRLREERKLRPKMPVARL